MNLARAVLAVVGVAAVGLVVFLLSLPIEKETFATLAAALAVIAAVIAAWPSLRVLELQEDAGRPSPIPYFDVTSRYGLVLLRVKNFGASVAYDVRLRWDKQRPRDHDGADVTKLDELSVLVPQDSVSAWVGPGHLAFVKNETTRFTGTVEFKDITGRSLSQRFMLDLNDQRERPMHDDETLKTLDELQKVPKLQAIADAVSKLNTGR